MRDYIDEDKKSFFEEHGYVKVKGVYDDQEINSYLIEINQLRLKLLGEEVIQQNKNHSVSSLFPTLRNPHIEYEFFRKWALDSRNFNIIEKIFGEESLIVGCTIFHKGPGSKRLPMHQDNYDIGAFPSTSCALWISLDIADEENGCLRIVPKTHKLGLLRPNHPGHYSEYGQTVKVPDKYATVSVSTQPGDVVLFNGNVLHGSGNNSSTTRFRRAFVIHFVRNSTKKIFVMNKLLWNKQEESVSKPFNKQHSITRLFIE